eukprot:scaffold6346_cov143-Pinguiococcus_pyrenoidosus.AAC.1
MGEIVRKQAEKSWNGIAEDPNVHGRQRILSSCYFLLRFSCGFGFTSACLSLHLQGTTMNCCREEPDALACGVEEIEMSCASLRQLIPRPFHFSKYVRIFEYSSTNQFSLISSSKELIGQHGIWLGLSRQKHKHPKASYETR